MMERKIGLKSREEENLPPEKLMEILYEIYPEKIARKLFCKLQGESDDSEDRRAE